MTRADTVNAQQVLDGVLGGHLIPNDHIWAANTNWSLALISGLMNDDDSELIMVEVVDDETEDEGEEEEVETITYGDGLGGGMGGDDGMGGGGMGSSGVVA